MSALNAAGVPVAGTSAGAAFITEHMIAFVMDPLVEIPRHQLAAVQRGRLLALAGAHQLLEAQCVAAQRTGCGTQAQ